MSEATAPFTVVRRDPSGRVSTFFNEVVTCRTEAGELRMLLKRGGAHADPTYGHRGGVPYEAEIYRRVLEPLGLSTARLHAVETDPAGGDTTLWIDYLDDAQPLGIAEPGALLLAARWIGEFHRRNEPRVAELAGCVHRYDAEYYIGWAERTQRFASGCGYAWLPALRRRWPDLARELLAPPLTVIHGEYYPGNILVRDRIICPVDWESAAIAAGEIDLASVTEGWPEEDRRVCQAEYRRWRQREDTVAGFERRLAIAEMYLAFRWLGDRQEWVRTEDAEWRFGRLLRLAGQLGVQG